MVEGSGRIVAAVELLHVAIGAISTRLSSAQGAQPVRVLSFERVGARKAGVLWCAGQSLGHLLPIVGSEKQILVPAWVQQVLDSGWKCASKSCRLSAGFIIVGVVFGVDEIAAVKVLHTAGAGRRAARLWLSLASARLFTQVFYLRFRGSPLSGSVPWAGAVPDYFHRFAHVLAQTCTEWNIGCPLASPRTEQEELRRLGCGSALAMPG